MKPCVETRIVWLVPGARVLPWVRERMAYSDTREGPPEGTRNERMVAYAEVAPGSRRVRGSFDRRCWFIHAGDPTCFRNEAGLVDRAPFDGVLPASIAPNLPSVGAHPYVAAAPLPWQPRITFREG